MNLEDTTASLAVVTNEELLEEDEIDHVTDFFTNVAEIAEENNNLVNAFAIRYIFLTGRNSPFHGEIEIFCISDY